MIDDAPKLFMSNNDNLSLTNIPFNMLKDKASFSFWLKAVNQSLPASTFTTPIPYETFALNITRQVNSSSSPELLTKIANKYNVTLNLSMSYSIFDFGQQGKYFNGFVNF